MDINNSNAIQDIVNKIPITLYFSQIPDRKQALNYIQWLYANIPQSKTVNQDQLFRSIISRELRIVSMKITEIDILLLVALDSITLEDFSLDNELLVKKLISQNKDKNDLDVIYRILAQVMSKLPRDIKDKITGKQKMLIFQAVSKYIINLDPKLLEKFIAFDPTLNTPITMELEQGDYNTLNKKYLTLSKEYQDTLPYINSNSLEFATIATKMLASSTLTATTIPASSKLTSTIAIKGQYIDTQPDLMVGADDNKIYYFDSSSGTISEMPSSNDSKQIPVSINDMTTVLLANKVNKGHIKDLVSSLQPTTTISATPTTTKSNSFFSSLTEMVYKLINMGYTITTVPQTTQPQITLAPLPTQPIPPLFISSQEKKALQIPNPIYTPLTLNSAQVISHFTNMKTNNTKHETELIKKLTKNNNDIENVAITFVSVIILLFLLVIFNSIKHNKDKK